eukprot:scaffold213_cov245-Pinguiococcus_pyrenoidosus.AAC.38
MARCSLVYPSSSVDCSDLSSSVVSFVRSPIARCREELLEPSLTSSSANVLGLSSVLATQEVLDVLHARVDARVDALSLARILFLVGRCASGAVTETLCRPHDVQPLGALAAQQLKEPPSLHGELRKGLVQSHMRWRPVRHHGSSQDFG